MIIKILFSTLLVGVSADVTAKYYGKECVAAKDEKFSCPEVVLQPNNDTFTALIYDTTCLKCENDCRVGFTGQRNIVGNCPLKKGVWKRNTKLPPNCDSQPDFEETFIASNVCIQEYNLVAPSDPPLYMVVPVYSLSGEDIDRLNGYDCPALPTASLRDVITCTAYAYGVTSLTTFDSVSRVSFRHDEGGFAFNDSFIIIDDESIKIRFSFRIGDYPAPLTVGYSFINFDGVESPVTIDKLNTIITKLPVLSATTSSVGSCEILSTDGYHNCSVVMKDDLGPVDGPLSSFSVSITDYDIETGCVITATKMIKSEPGKIMFSVIRSGVGCVGEQNAIVNIKVNNKQISSIDGIKEGLVISDNTTAPPTPAPTAAPVLAGHTDAFYQEGNHKWGCQSTHKLLNKSCNPIVRHSSSSSILIELFKDLCPPDLSCQINCPGGNTTMTVLEGPCKSVSEFPWGKASRGKPCDSGTPKQADFVTGGIRTAGCITQWRLVDSFGGLIMFDDFDISASETVKLSNIQCPDIDSAFLRQKVKCSAYAWGDSQLTSFNSSQFRFISLEPSIGGTAMNGLPVSVSGQFIKYEFDYVLGAIPTDTTEFNYQVHYERHSKKSTYPVRNVVLSTANHRLPKLQPGVESTIRCESVNSTDVNFLHTCTVVTLDNEGPVDIESLTDFDVDVEVRAHTKCEAFVSNYFNVSPGRLRFNISRMGNDTCRGTVTTVVNMTTGGETITSFLPNGDKVKQPLVISDNGPPIRPTPAPPTSIPPTDSPPTPAPPTSIPLTRAPYTHAPATGSPDDSKSKKAELVYGTLAIITGILLIVALTYLLVRNRQKQIAGTFSIIGNADSGGDFGWQGHVPIYEDEGPSTQLQDLSPAREEYVSPETLLDDDNDADDGPLILNEATSQNIQHGNGGGDDPDDYTVAM